MTVGEASTILNQSAGNVISAYQAKASKEYAEKNFELQSDNFDYQKALQQKIFDREDTALQRYVADLKSAGLNPQLAAGSSGSGTGSVVSTTPPQHDAKWLDKLRVNLDYVTAIESIAQQRYQTAILKEKSRQAKMDYEVSSSNAIMAHHLANRAGREDELERQAQKLYDGTITPEEFNKYSWYLTPILNSVTEGNASKDLKMKERDTYNLRTILDFLGSLTSSYRKYRGW